MIDLDDLIDDLNESAAQSYDELSRATIDVLHRAVAALQTLRNDGAGALQAVADEIDEYYPTSVWPAPSPEQLGALHEFAKTVGFQDGSPFHVSGIRHAIKQVRQKAAELARGNDGNG